MGQSGYSYCGQYQNMSTGYEAIAIVRITLRVQIKLV